jgi:hypothetical protein
MIYQWQIGVKTKSDTIVAHLFDSISPGNGELQASQSLFSHCLSMIYQWQIGVKTKSDTIVAQLFESISPGNGELQASQSLFLSWVQQIIVRNYYFYYCNLNIKSKLYSVTIF